MIFTHLFRNSDISLERLKGVGNLQFTRRHKDKRESILQTCKLLSLRARPVFISNLTVRFVDCHPLEVYQRIRDIYYPLLRTISVSDRSAQSVKYLDTLFPSLEVVELRLLGDLSLNEFLVPSPYLIPEVQSTWWTTEQFIPQALSGAFDSKLKSAHSARFSMTGKSWLNKFVASYSGSDRRRFRLVATVAAEWEDTWKSVECTWFEVTYDLDTRKTVKRVAYQRLRNGVSVLAGEDSSCQWHRTTWEGDSVVKHRLNSGRLNLDYSYQLSQGWKYMEIQDWDRKEAETLSQDPALRNLQVSLKPAPLHYRPRRRKGFRYDPLRRYFWP
jgi:hypothetical protein